MGSIKRRYNKNIMEDFSLDKEVADKYVENIIKLYKFKHKNGVIALSSSFRLLL